MGSKKMIRDSESYRGQFVATRSFKNNKVVVHGNDPIRVFNDAKAMGVKDPIITYVPPKGMTSINAHKKRSL